MIEMCSISMHGWQYLSSEFKAPDWVLISLWKELFANKLNRVDMDTLDKVWQGVVLGVVVTDDFDLWAVDAAIDCSLAVLVRGKGTLLGLEEFISAYSDEDPVSSFSDTCFGCLPLEFVRILNITDADMQELDPLRDSGWSMIADWLQIGFTASWHLVGSFLEKNDVNFFDLNLDFKEDVLFAACDCILPLENILNNAVVGTQGMCSIWLLSKELDDGHCDDCSLTSLLSSEVAFAERNETWQRIVCSSAQLIQSIIDWISWAELQIAACTVCTMDRR